MYLEFSKLTELLRISFSIKNPSWLKAYERMFENVTKKKTPVFDDQGLILKIWFFVLHLCLKAIYKVVSTTGTESTTITESVGIESTDVESVGKEPPSLTGVHAITAMLSKNAKNRFFILNF